MSFGWIASSAIAWKRLLSGDAKYWIVSVLGVQGSTYVAQILLGRALSPEDFGVARSVESYFGIITILGAFGLPSAACRCSAIADQKSQGAEMTQVVMLALLSSTLTAVGFALANQFLPGLIPARSASLLMVMLPSIVAGCLVRTALAFVQGALRLRRLAWLSVIPATMTLLLIPLVVPTAGLVGWAWLRNLVECCALLLVFLFAGKWTLKGWSISRFSSNLKIAFPSMLAFSFEKAATVADLLILEWLGKDYKEVGSYGAATVLAFVLTVPAGAINVIAFRGMAKAELRSGSHVSSLRAVIAETLLLTGPLAVLLSVGGGSMVTVAFGPGYSVSPAIMVILGGAVLARGVLSNLGTLALAIGLVRVPVIGNLVGLLVASFSCMLMVPSLGLAGAAWGGLLGTVARLFVFYMGIRQAAPAASRPR